MRNATIATSRTRATDDLIDYRPLPAAWGDAEALRELRRARTRIAAATGEDPTTVELSDTGRRHAGAGRTRAAASSRREHSPGRRRRPRRGLLTMLRRAGIHAAA